MDGSSVMSKSFSSICAASRKMTDGGDDRSRSIREHASRIHDFAMARKESTCKQIEHATQKKRYDTIQLEIGWLCMEKWQLLFQKCSIAPGLQHDNMENALTVSIAKVDEEFENYKNQLSQANMTTPQKSNRSPSDK